MRYPKKLSKRADEILAARRQTAQERHRSAMAALNEQHPEINAAGRELARLYAQRARASLTHDQDTSEMEEAIRAAQSRRAAALAAAGVTEADLEPAYTCPLCRDRGVKEGGQMCECRQVILNQLVYEQLCDVSPARECSFENFELRYYDEKLRPIMAICTSFPVREEINGTLTMNNWYAFDGAAAFDGSRKFNAQIMQEEF